MEHDARGEHDARKGHHYYTRIGHRCARPSSDASVRERSTAMMLLAGITGRGLNEI